MPSSTGAAPWLKPTRSKRTLRTTSRGSAVRCSGTRGAGVSSSATIASAAPIASIRAWYCVPIPRSMR